MDAMEVDAAADESSALKTAYDDAGSVTDDAAAIAAYVAIFETEEGDAEELKKYRGLAVVKLGKLYSKTRQAQKCEELLTTVRAQGSKFAKSKTMKIVRSLVDSVEAIPDTLGMQESMLRTSIDWCKTEKRNFLRQRLETRLSAVLLRQEKYEEALSLVRVLLREVKKLDDKQLMTEISLIESRVHQQLRNTPKAKASLTAARTNANAIYVPPKLQAEIDLQAGVLCAEERDYKTGFSYFFEGFEGYHQLKDKRAVLCLKYMLLCKVMMDKANEVPGLLAGKSALQYRGADVSALQAVAVAYKKRSLKALDKVLVEHKSELEDDLMVQRHLQDLHEKLLEQNLCRLIEPYSRVEISHIAKLIDLPLRRVETKLSQMILDDKFHGILDQGRGYLTVHDVVSEDKTMESGLAVVKNMNLVVDTLFKRSEKLYEPNDA